MYKELIVILLAKVNIPYGVEDIALVGEYKHK